VIGAIFLVFRDGYLRSNEAFPVDLGAIDRVVSQPVITAVI
jgi:hypothetical protein